MLEEYDHYSLTSSEPTISCYGTSYKTLQAAKDEAAELQRLHGLCTKYVIGGLKIGVGWTTVFDSTKD